jgi:hypothetical protein
MLSASSWRPVFSAKPDALKAAAADSRGVSRPDAVADSGPGRFLKFDAAQTFSSDGRVTNAFRLARGVVSLSFDGAFDMSGRRMTICFESLRVALLFGLIRFTLNIREGRGLRAFIERWVRPRGARTSAAAGAQPFQKRPNVYAWCYADRSLCVAQGSSGAVAVWAAIPPDAVTPTTATSAAASRPMSSTTVDERDESGETQLIRAAEAADEQTVMALLAAGADASLASYTSWTAMHGAAESGSVGAISALAAAGGDVSARAKSGKTPLDIARQYERPDAARALVALGAVANLTS